MNSENRTPKSQVDKTTRQFTAIIRKVLPYCDLADRLGAGRTSVPGARPVLLASLALRCARNQVDNERHQLGMMADASFDEMDLPFSRFVAEALIARDGPDEISARAEELGLSPVARDIAVCACAAAACDHQSAIVSWTTSDSAP
jgi:hypothetical protein